MSNFNLFGRGWQITNKHGITLSVNIGKGGYNTNRFNDGAVITSLGQTIAGANAEISIWDKDVNDYFPEVAKGWCGVDEVLHYMNEVRTAETLSQITKYTDK